MEKEKKYCSNCGTEIKDDTKFCVNCGTKIENEIEVEKVEKRRGRPKKVEEDKEIESPKEKPQINIEELKNELRGELLTEIKKETDEQEKNRKKNEIEISEFKSKIKIYPIVSCVITLLLCLVAFGFFYNYYMKNLVIETTRTEKEVTVNENGISDAVEKVYDATVVVESYINGRLYATGSGFVYKTDDNFGYILTNNHVINGATDVKVLFSNEKRETVKVLGSDAYSDIALLRVDKDNVISVAETGSTDELKVGDTAFAVGAPLDSQAYAWTVTRGIISGKNRTVQVSATNSRASQVMEVLQTDAAINSGNSGGPLCNSNGEVIGITNMKLASSSIEGMGFAIPIEKATEIADQFMNGGVVTYPYLGVALNDTSDGGALVEEVEKGSPADKGGIKQGDIIIKIDGKDVTSASYLKYNLYKHKVGDKVSITVKRNGEEKVLEITLGSNGEKA